MSGRVDLVRLAALAAAATPGPWDYDGRIAACHPGVVAALVEAVQAARGYQAEMERVAHEWRMDWSDFDGRILRDQEMDASRALAAALAVFGDESPEPFEAQSAESADVRADAEATPEGDA